LSQVDLLNVCIRHSDRSEIYDPAHIYMLSHALYIAHIVVAAGRTKMMSLRFLKRPKST